MCAVRWSNHEFNGSFVQYVVSSWFPWQKCNLALFVCSHWCFVVESDLALSIFEKQNLVLLTESFVQQLDGGWFRTKELAGGPFEIFTFADDHDDVA